MGGVDGKSRVVSQESRLGKHGVENVRCTLIYNPFSGQNRQRRSEQVGRVAEALRELGQEVELVSTTAPGSATDQTRDAVAHGAEVVFACGGDGTVHEVVQGLVDEAGNHRASLGIIPMGSENALSRNLGISFDPVKAALEQLQGTVQTIPVGKLAYGEQVRYFVLMAGAGPDGALVHSLTSKQKSRLGRLAYYVHAARLFATRQFPAFKVEYTRVDSETSITANAVSVMVVRAGDLGGLFSKLTDRQASIHERQMRLLVVRGPGIISLPLWFLSGWLNLSRFNPFLKFVQVSWFSCSSSAVAAPYFQADGEWLGQIPFECSLVPDALSILVP